MCEIVSLPVPSKVQISATLKNAQRITEDREGKKVTTNLRGQVYGGRGLADGEWIVTSRIQEELPGNIFKTTNSYYQVEFSAAALAEAALAAAKEAA